MSEELSRISQRVSELLAELPPGVRLVAAAKGRPPEAVLEAIDAGIAIIGENYVQDAEKAQAVIGCRAQWHFIGHLQKNKVRKAVQLFDMIETVDSSGIAGEIDRACRAAGKVMPVLIEVNSGREAQKTGVLPEVVEPLLREIAHLPNLKVLGLMTMGPRYGEAENFRPCFAETRRVFERIKGINMPNVEMKYLSMGMSDSYRVALQEGANIIRIGSRIFGPVD